MEKFDIEKYKEGIEIIEDIDPDKVWASAKELIRIKIQTSNYNMWFKDVYISDIRNGVAEFVCPSEYHKNNILSDFSIAVKESLKQVTGNNLEIRFNIVENNKKDKYQYINQNDLNKDKNSEVGLFTNIDKEKEIIQKAISSSNLNPKYTFKNFIIGTHNRLAEAVARVVVKDLGKAYNPVFYYGSTGLGKTHLMQAIGNEVIKKDPKKNVVYVSIEEFLNELIDSIRTKKDKQFRDKYRKVDLLIIDDIQFVENFPKTQEALFHTFNTLYQENKQIILASDRPPSEIKNLTDRLKSRFEGGMVADITEPDFETRVAILKQITNDKGVKIPLNYLKMIASNVDSNVRKLEGSLNKIITITQLGSLPTEEEVSKLLEIDIASVREKMTPEKIAKAVCDVFYIKYSDIKKGDKKAVNSLARQTIMYILRNDLNYTLEKTANFLKRKDHTTIMHGSNKIEYLLEHDSNYKERYDKVRKLLKN